MTHRIDPKRHPLAFMLRARREQAEAEIRAPVEAVLDLCRSRLRAAEKALRSLQAVIGTKVGERMLARLTDDLARYCHRVVRDAITAARADGGVRNGVVRLSILENDLRWLDPKSIERAILEEWRLHAADLAEACADLNAPMAEKVTKLVVRIPAIQRAENIMPGIESTWWSERYRDGEKSL